MELEFKDIINGLKAGKVYKMVWEGENYYLKIGRGEILERTDECQFEIAVQPPIDWLNHKWVEVDEQA